MKNPAARVRAFALLGLGALLVVLLAVGGVALWNHGRNAYWWGTSDAQQHLLDDPMAARDLLGLTLVREDVARPVGIATMPKGAYVHHWFDPAGRPEQVLAELGALAATQGWTQRADLTDSTVWVATKEVSGPLEARLIISLEGIDGQVAAASEADVVRVSLIY